MLNIFRNEKNSNSLVSGPARKELQLMAQSPVTTEQSQVSTALPSGEVR